MFELWREPAVCEHAGPAVDTDGHSIELPAASRAQSDRLLRFWLDRARAGTGFRWAVLAGDDSDFAGAVGFNALAPCAEYAYHLVPRCWGRGLATEASQLALSWCFSTGSESVELYIEAANERSSRLAVRLGFERAGPRDGDPSRYLLRRERHTE